MTPASPRFGGVFFDPLAAAGLAAGHFDAAIQHASIGRLNPTQGRHLVFQ
jgi:hypothetical protein